MKGEFIREIFDGMTEYLKSSSTLRRQLTPLVRVSRCHFVDVGSKSASAPFQNLNGGAPFRVDRIGQGFAARGLNIVQRATVLLYLCDASSAHGSPVSAAHFAVSNTHHLVRHPNEEVSTS
jgi:hypothetical protein